MTAKVLYILLILEFIHPGSFAQVNGDYLEIKKKKIRTVKFSTNDGARVITLSYTRKGSLYEIRRDIYADKCSAAIFKNEFRNYSLCNLALTKKGSLIEQFDTLIGTELLFWERTYDRFSAQFDTVLDTEPLELRFKRDMLLSNDMDTLELYANYTDEIKSFGPNRLSDNSIVRSGIRYSGDTSFYYSVYYDTSGKQISLSTYYYKVKKEFADDSGKTVREELRLNQVYYYLNIVEYRFDKEGKLIRKMSFFPNYPYNKDTAFTFVDYACYSNGKIFSCDKTIGKDRSRGNITYYSQDGAALSSWDHDKEWGPELQRNKIFLADEKGKFSSEYDLSFFIEQVWLDKYHRKRDKGQSYWKMEVEKYQ